MLRGVEFLERILERGSIGGDLRVLHAVAGGGQPRVGDLDALLDGGELAGFEIRELLFGAS